MERRIRGGMNGEVEKKMDRKRKGVESQKDGGVEGKW